MIAGFIYAYLFILIVPIFLCVVSALFAFMALYKLYQFIKGIYVFNNIDRVHSMLVYAPVQKYKEVKEKTGVSVGHSFSRYGSSYHYTEHYRIRRVKNGLSWKVKVNFKNNRHMMITIDENSILYNRIKAVSGLHS